MDIERLKALTEGDAEDLLIQLAFFRASVTKTENGVSIDGPYSKHAMTLVKNLHSAVVQEGLSDWNEAVAWLTADAQRVFFDLMVDKCTAFRKRGEKIQQLEDELEQSRQNIRSLNLKIAQIENSWQDIAKQTQNSIQDSHEIEQFGEEMRSLRAQLQQALQSRSESSPALKVASSAALGWLIGRSI